MKIDRYNYETFLVDYLDGKLGPTMAAELMLFLEQNPDIKNEVDGLSEVVLASDPICFPNKSVLKKNSFSKNGIDNEQDYLLIAALEGVLTKDEKKKFIDEIGRNEKLKTEYSLYEKVTIQPPVEIVYPNKGRLKRIGIIPLSYSSLRKIAGVAASIGLLVGIYTWSEMGTRNNIGSRIRSKTTASAEVAQKMIPQPASSSDTPTAVGVTKSQQHKANRALDLPKADTTAKNEPTRKEEVVPLPIARIEYASITNRKNDEYEQIARYIEAEPKPSHLFETERNYYSENSNTRSTVKEVGVFEIIQYGVRSFGKLIGKDIRLNADKDKSGRIEKIRFESDLVAFSAPIRKKE